MLVVLSCKGNGASKKDDVISLELAITEGVEEEKGHARVVEMQHVAYCTNPVAVERLIYFPNFWLKLEHANANCF